MSMLKRLIIVFLIITPVYDLQAGRRARVCSFGKLDTVQVLAAKIRALKEKAGTFEGLLPVGKDSFADSFPELYEKLRMTFMVYPSYLTAMNAEIAPVAGSEFGRILTNIHQEAFYIGTKIREIAYSLPQTSHFREILHSYADRFQTEPSKEGARRIDEFDPQSQGQMDILAMYGNKIIDSVWAELRISLRIGHLSRVNVTVRKLIAEGVIENSDGRLNKFLDQEIDQLSFTTDQRGRAIAVAFSDTKVFETPFDENKDNRGKVYGQLERYLEIASIIGPKIGQEPRVYYFFVAGISKKEIGKLNAIAARLNKDFASRDSTKWAEVKFKVYGDYEAGPQEPVDSVD